MKKKVLVGNKLALLIKDFVHKSADGGIRFRQVSIDLPKEMHLQQFETIENATLIIEEVREIDASPHYEMMKKWAKE